MVVSATVCAGAPDMDGLPTIFLAEDSPADVYLFGEALKAHGVECNLMVFHDGETALASVRASSCGTPHIFVLDLNLPKIDGREILKYIRRTPGLAETPVVILTSSSSVADRSETTDMGASCYICKPLNISDFLEIGGVIKALLRLTRITSHSSAI